MMWIFQPILAWIEPHYLLLEWIILVWLGPDCAVNLAFAALCLWAVLCPGALRWNALLAAGLYLVLAFV
ncbi:MAG: hypothetical protein AAGD04_10575 [Pseudomonadota bacterium]